MEDAEAQLPDETFACPHCGQAVDSSHEGEDGLMTCPACGEQFVLPETSQDAPAALDDESARHEEELDGMRIRNVATARRAAIRRRSYAIIAAGTCAVAVGQLVFMTYRHFRYHLAPIIKPIGYVMCAIAGVWGIVYFLRRATELQQEADHSALDEPTTPPDFSPLSDGSQHVKNLEQMK